MRLAVAAALPFPRAHGSQVFVEEQARALGAAGADVTLFCYGRGDGEDPEGLKIERIPAALSPRTLRTGPSPGKPVADLALARLLASAEGRFDAVLAHNGEAALAALLVRRKLGAPVIYVAHTLLANELDAYAPRAFGGLARGFGDIVDRGVAARVDAVIALSANGAQRLGQFAGGPVEVIPPGLDPAPAPEAGAVAAACSRAGVEPGRFVLYSGNLDRYQDLDLLAEAAERVPGIPIVIATHGTARFERSGIRCMRTGAEEARALTYGCGVAVLPRTRAGGFPVKLLNYMEAGRAIVAREGIADGLVHGRSAWLLPGDAPPAELAAAFRTLLAEPDQAAALGDAARATLEQRHAWPALARRTLDLIAKSSQGSSVR